MRPALRRTGTLVSLALALAAGCGGGAPEPKEKAEEIPLKSIHVTFKQEGTIFVESEEGEFGKFIPTLYKAHSGPSNLFLVRGKTARQAAEATVRVMVGGATGDFPSPRRGAEGRPYWLVVFLGRGGSAPPIFQVDSARKSGKVIRLTVVRPKREGSTKDDHLYMVWVPLGRLADGTHKLELHDKANDEPSLVRRVVVKDKDL